MIREVNLLEHLPLYVRNYREIQGIMKAERPEFQTIEDDSETIKNNMFVLHTDEVGIKRYETMFGLASSPNDTLHNRQMTVLAHYSNTVIYTLRGLIERLNMVCGAENYTLELNANEYQIIITINSKIRNLVGTISSMVANMIPANMICTYVVDYNTHKLLANYPTYLLMQFTQQELHDEVIGDSISATCDNITNYTMGSFESVSCEHMANFGMRKV